MKKIVRSIQTYQDVARRCIAIGHSFRIDRIILFFLGEHSYKQNTFMYSTCLERLQFPHVGLGAVSISIIVVLQVSMLFSLELWEIL